MRVSQRVREGVSESKAKAEDVREGVLRTCLLTHPCTRRQDGLSTVFSPIQQYLPIFTRGCVTILFPLGISPRIIAPGRMIV